MKVQLHYSTLIAFAIFILTLTSCDIDLNINDPDNPYEQYSGRMIERIRITDSGHNSDYIYYGYDRKGRITSIENTYYGTIENYAYSEDQYGEDIITVWNNLGDDRDIRLDWICRTRGSI